MSKFAIYAGHGGKDSGAVGNGYLEKNVTLEVSKKVTTILKNAGHTVINNRTTDITSEINDKAALANKNKVNAVVDIHLNANSGTPGTGTETFYSVAGGKSKEMASEINKEIVKLGYRDRGIKTRLGDNGRDYFGIIRLTDAPSVLVETAFINNPDDMKRYDTQKMAHAIANGVMAVFGGKAQTTTAGTGTSTTGTGTGTGGTNANSGSQVASNPYAEPKANVSQGSKGNGVKWVQWYLKKYGYDIGTAGIDGICGVKTAAAIKAFQKAKKLIVDGICGVKTRTALKQG